MSIEYNLEIKDLTPNKKKKTNQYIKNYLAPIPSFQFLVSGGTGRGKTMAIINLILHHLKFDRLYIYSRHLYDKNDLYLPLIQTIQKAEKRIKKKLKDEDYRMLWYSDQFQDIPSYEAYDDNYMNLVLIDDFMLEPNQDKVIEYFTSGRHRNISTFYLTQSYFSVKRKIRLNCNYLAFFEFASAREVRMISSELCSDKTYDELYEIFKTALDRKFSFLLIDLKTDDPCMKYRRNFNELLLCDENDSPNNQEII